MKIDQPTETTTSTPIGILNARAGLRAESDSILPLPVILPRSEQMNFTINGEEYVFTLDVDAQET